MDFRRKGYCYEVIIHTGRKHKNEYIKWIVGYRNLWERISEAEYLAAERKEGV